MLLLSNLQLPTKKNTLLIHFPKVLVLSREVLPVLYTCIKEFPPPLIFLYFMTEMTATGVFVRNGGVMSANLQTVKTPKIGL